MKNIPILDMLVILIIAAFFTLITYLGYAKFLSTYQIVIALIAYFVGKYIGRIELKRKLKEQESQ